MKIQVEVAILEKSVMVQMIENCIEEYMKGPKASVVDRKEMLKVISDQLERVKEMNLVSFYGVSSHVSLDQPEIKE